MVSTERNTIPMLIQTFHVLNKDQEKSHYDTLYVRVAWVGNNICTRILFLLEVVLKNRKEKLTLDDLVGKIQSC